MLFSGDYNH